MRAEHLDTVRPRPPGCTRARGAALAVGLLALLVASGCGQVAPPSVPSRTASAAEMVPSSASALSAADAASLLGSVATDTQAAPGEPRLARDGIYVPPTLDSSRPVQVLLALHGMGGSGPRITARLRDCADRLGWVVVAPTMAYRDYMDPEQLRLDDQQNLPWVQALLDRLRAAAGPLPLAEQVNVYGFSRGAQMAARLAMFYPESVAAVAALSGGSYTMPVRSAPVNGQVQRAQFPFGVADLEKYSGEAFDTAAFTRVPFWIGVGAADTNSADTSRPWDVYEGRTRVERARRFSSTLEAMGVQVQLQLFSGAGHEETTAMRASACDFFGQVAQGSTSPNPLNARAPAPATP